MTAMAVILLSSTRSRNGTGWSAWSTRSQTISSSSARHAQHRPAAALAYRSPARRAFSLVPHSASPSIDVVGAAWPGPGGRGGPGARRCCYRTVRPWHQDLAWPGHALCGTSRWSFCSRLAAIHADTGDAWAASIW